MQNINMLAPFGGGLQKGKRKNKRPLSTKTPMHLILKSEKARALQSFVNKKRKIESIEARLSKKYGMKVYSEAIHYNHIHYLIKISSVENYRSWIREFTAALAKLMGIENFFTQKPFTRIISSQQDFQNVIDYHVINELEVAGFSRRETCWRKFKSVAERTSDYAKINSS